MDDMTLFEGRFEERLRSFARAGVQSVDSAAVARAVAIGHPKSAATRPPRLRLLDEIHRTRQRTVVGPWRTRSTVRTALGAAVVVAVVALGGAFVVIQRDQPAILGPSPTPSAVPSPSPSPSLPAVAVPSGTPTPTSTSSAEASPPPVGQTLKLTWTKVSLDQRSPQVAWLGDQFVLVDQDSGAVFTSADGFSWHTLQPGDPDPGYVELLRPRHIGAAVSWQDQIVGWWNPQDGPDVGGKPPITARDIVRIVRPPAAPTDATPFKGRIQSLAIGPAGIVAFVASHLDFDEWVASKLGKNWVSHYTGVDFKNGILKIGMDNGPGLRVNWADQGFEPGDYLYGGFGWFSPDGEEWTPIPGYLTYGFDEVVGVSDGFIAIARGEVSATCSLPDGCGPMWHSSDGLTWRNLGPIADGHDGPMQPWMGGALVTDGVGTFDFWTSQGYRELPMAAEVRAAWKQPDAGFGTGPLGIVTVLRDDGKVLVTRDGVEWEIAPIPAEMAADSTLRPGNPHVAVGDRSVLVVMSSGSYEAPIRSLWLGTVEP